MKRTVRIWLTMIVAALIALSGCANQDQGSAGNNDRNNGNNMSDGRDNGQGAGGNNESRARNITRDRGPGMRGTGPVLPLADNNGSEAAIELVKRDGREYVPLRTLVDTLGFRSLWDDASGTFQVGDNDVAYELKADSTEAKRDGEPLHLGHPVVRMNGSVYIPYSELASVFGDAMDFRREGNRIIIFANLDDPHDDGGLPDFADDPNDPYRTSDAKQDKGKVSYGLAVPVTAGQIEENVQAAAAAVALKNIDIDGMLRFARRYIGVPYKFGAKPGQTKNFDCSTFTLYVYGKYGVKLPRLSRQQAKVGTTVSRSKLRKGDLLFFYVPGRFKSNKIVGHVGIYIGDGKMINATTSPKNGVQISNINKAFWKKTFLHAKRVAY